MQEYRESAGRDIFGNHIITTESGRNLQNNHQPGQSFSGQESLWRRILANIWSATAWILGFLAGSWVAHTIFQLLGKS